MRVICKKYKTTAPMKPPNTTAIYLIGKPGTGKYTISKELAKDGYVICDNQLVNNPIFALLNYDGLMPVPENAWNAIARIRNVVFDFIANERDKSYVFTNVLGENAGDHKLFKQVQRIASKRKSLFIPVKLLISEEENKKRIVNIERLHRYKSIDIEDASAENRLIEISHPNLLELDVTDLSAEDAAGEILAWIKMQT